MEKKTYIKPEIEVMEMTVEGPMLTASSFGLNDQEVDTETAQLSNRYDRRGKWGDLWYVEEE